MMRTLLLVILFSFFQNSSPDFTISEKTNLIHSDNLENLYLIDRFTLKKYSNKGVEMFTYSNNFLGKISSIAIGEGLKVMLYFQETGTLVILDNTLSELSPPVNLNFNRLGTSTLVTTSVQNSFWFYDPLQGAIIRTTNTFSEIFNSGNLDQMLGLQIEPNFMVESNNRLYVNDPVQGILIFDLFGTYLKTIPIVDLKRFQVTEKGIYFTQKETLYFYNFKDFQTSTLPFNRPIKDQVRVTSKMIYLKEGNTVSGWKRKTD